jgi:hypothetical protein
MTGTEISPGQTENDQNSGRIRKNSRIFPFAVADAFFSYYQLAIVISTGATHSSIVSRVVRDPRISLFVFAVALPLRLVLCLCCCC